MVRNAVLGCLVLIGSTVALAQEPTTVIAGHTFVRSQFTEVQAGAEAACPQHHFHAANQSHITDVTGTFTIDDPHVLPPSFDPCGFGELVFTGGGAPPPPPPPPGPPPPGGGGGIGLPPDLQIPGVLIVSIIENQAGPEGYQKLGYSGQTGGLPNSTGKYGGAAPSVRATPAGGLTSPPPDAELPGLIDGAVQQGGSFGDPNIPPPPTDPPPGCDYWQWNYQTKTWEPGPATKPELPKQGGWFGDPNIPPPPADPPPEGYYWQWNYQYKMWEPGLAAKPELPKQGGWFGDPNIPPPPTDPPPEGYYWQWNYQYKMWEPGPEAKPEVPKQGGWFGDPNIPPPPTDPPPEGYYWQWNYQYKMWEPGPEAKPEVPKQGGWFGDPNIPPPPTDPPPEGYYWQWNHQYKMWEPGLANPSMGTGLGQGGTPSGAFERQNTTTTKGGQVVPFWSCKLRGRILKLVKRRAKEQWTQPKGKSFDGGNFDKGMDKLINAIDGGKDPKDAAKSLTPDEKAAIDGEKDDVNKAIDEQKDQCEKAGDTEGAKACSDLKAAINPPPAPGK